MANRFGAFLAFVNVGWLVGCGSQPSSSHEVTAQKASALPAAPVPVVVGPAIGTVPALPVQYDTGHSPELASAGSGQLVVFEDAGRVRAVRLDASGAVLDIPWIDLGETDRVQTYPSVTSDGQRYLVTWSDSIPSGTLTVRGRFVAANGAPVGSTSFAISSGEGLYPSVAWNGTNYVATWLALAGNGVNDIASVLIGSSGAKVAGTERTVSTSHQTTRPRVVAGTSSSLVAWEDYSGTISVIRAAHIGADGNIGELNGFPLSNGSFAMHEVKLASSGTRFLAAWRIETTPSTIFGALVGTGATPMATFPISNSSADTGVPSVAFDGTGFAVIWADGRDENSVYGSGVSVEGSVVGTTAQKLATGKPRTISGSDATSLLWNGKNYVTAFLGHGVEGSLLNANLSVADPALEFSPLPSKQSSPFVTYNGHDYVLAWVDEPDTSVDTMYGRAVRISAAGQVLDPNGITLGSDTQKAFSLGIASAGAGPSLVTWSTLSGDGWLSTLSQSGVAGTATAVASGLSTSPGLASAGSGYLLATTKQTSTSVYAISGRLVSASGVLGAAIPIETSAAQPSATVLTAGDGFLVNYLGAGNASFLRPVSSAGAVSAAIPLSASQAFVTSASNGTQTLLVWSDPVDVRVQAQFYSGGALQGKPLLLSASSAGYPAPVAWDGEKYWIVWESDDQEHRADARTVSPSGTLGPVTRLLDEETFAPSIASDGHGHFILSYYQYAESSRTRRISSRLVDVTGTVPPGGDGGAGGGASTEGGAGGSSDGGDPGQGGTGNTGSGTGGNTSSGGLGTGNTGGSIDGVGGKVEGGTSNGGSTSAGTANSGGSGGSGGRNGSNGGMGSGAAGATGTSGASGGGESPPGGGCSLTRASHGQDGTPALLLAFALSLTLRRRARAARSSAR